MRYSNEYFTLSTELQTDAAPMLLWFVDCRYSMTFKLAPLGMRGALGLEYVDGLLYQTPDTFYQQTLLEPLTMTGASASCFGEQYRDLPYLHQNLDENNSTQQVKTAVQQHVHKVQYGCVHATYYISEQTVYSYGM